MSVKYSFWSMNPPPELVMNDNKVSAALRASSCVGEPGDEPTTLVTGVVVRPVILLLLLLCRS